MRFLRSNTAVLVTVGPFYDKTDGVTIETALTITNERITLTADTDDNAAPTNILDNVTGATSGTSNDLNYITGNDAGMMQLELSAANTNRVGRMLLSITDAANHVPVFHEFTVLPQAIYDWLIAGTIVPLPANMTQILGTAVSTPATAGILDVNVKNIDNDAASASGTVTFPNATLASTTNITAGTITTTTNLTNLPSIPANWLTAAGTAADFATELRTAINGGDWALSTDANGRVRIVDGTAAGELDTSSGTVTLTDGSLTAAKIGTAAFTAAKFHSDYTDLIEATVLAELETIKLHYLVNQALPAANEVADNSIVARLACKAATPSFGSFNNTTDSLEAQRDNIGTTGAALDVGASVWQRDIANDSLAGGSVAAFKLVGAANNAVALNVDWTDGGRLDLLLDAVKAKTDNLPASPAAVGSAMTLAADAVSAAALAADAVTEIRNAITGGNYALSTNASGHVRIADGTATGELDTNGGAIASVLALGATALASINAEVLDVVNVDTYAEPAQGTPPATASLAAKINFIHKFARNKKTQTASFLNLFNDDAATIDHKSAVADDGTTLTTGEFATGP